MHYRDPRVQTRYSTLPRTFDADCVSRQRHSPQPPMNTRIDPPDDQRHCNIAQSIVPGDANFRTGAERQPGQFRLRLSIHRTTKDLPDAGWSSGIRGCIEYQPRPPKPASEIAIRDRSRTRCEWGQNWGHNLIFSGCNYRSRAKSKCFLATLRVSKRCRAGCSADHFCLSTNHGAPFTSSGIATLGAHLRACFGWFERMPPA